MEHKIIDLKISKAVQNDDEGVIEGMASTFDNQDSYNDIFKQGAFVDSLNKFRAKGKSIPLLLNHDSMKLPLGGVDPNQSFENEKGLNVVGTIDLDTQDGKEAFSLLKKGFLTSFSVGFIPKEFDYRGEGGRIFKKVDLMEISLANVPANEEALISVVKAVIPDKDLSLASQDRRWDKNAAIPRVRELTGSTDSPSSQYKNAFLWYDSANMDNFGAYKLPIADVIDGELKAVPRAIFAAASAVSGGRGGVNVSDDDKSRIINNLNKYYSKMGKDSPFAVKNLDSYGVELLKCLKKLNMLFEIKKLFNEG